MGVKKELRARVKELEGELAYCDKMNTIHRVLWQTGASNVSSIIGAWVTLKNGEKAFIQMQDKTDMSLHNAPTVNDLCLTMSWDYTGPHEVLRSIDVWVYRGQDYKARKP
jgi:hypothetical protein